MKKTKVLYWIFTGLMAALLGVGAAFDAVSAPEAVEQVTHLGYPVYLIPFLGFAKIAAIAVILVPGFWRIKEWAYAGLVFDLAGALYSHIAVGDAAAVWLPIIVILGLVAGSYVFYHRFHKAVIAEARTNVSVAGK